jgi:hypothetical protein
MDGAGRGALAAAGVSALLGTAVLGHARSSTREPGLCLRPSVTIPKPEEAFVASHW